MLSLLLCGLLLFCHQPPRYRKDRIRRVRIQFLPDSTKRSDPEVSLLARAVQVTFLKIGRFRNADVVRLPLAS